MTQRALAIPSLVAVGWALAAVLAFSPAAMAQDGAAPAKSQAQPAKHNASSSPLDVISKGIKLKADPVESADFVEKSRPAELNYVPVGGARPEPKGKLLSLDELRAKEAELDALRNRHDQLAHRKPPTKVAYNPIAQEPKKKAPKKEVSCAITCEVKTTATAR